MVLMIVYDAMYLNGFVTCEGNQSHSCLANLVGLRNVYFATDLKILQKR